MLKGQPSTPHALTRPGQRWPWCGCSLRLPAPEGSSFRLSVRKNSNCAPENPQSGTQPICQLSFVSAAPQFPRSVRCRGQAVTWINCEWQLEQAHGMSVLTKFSKVCIVLTNVGTYQIVAIHTRQYNVVETPLGHRRCRAFRFRRVQWRRRLTGFHSTETTRYITRVYG